MFCTLIAAASASWLQTIGSLALAALGLGFVIFVHELGHFLVAKWCGVKCEKFYVGFDIYGWKLWSKQWGETEYGIGALPLGGYVKMLGQDDNPNAQADENQRAKAGGDEQAQWDPRSYMAQSVPERMAIISAGVIMNVIFAFIFCVIAWSVGVEYIPCRVGGVVPGGPAWQAGVRPGDEFVTVNGVHKPRFDYELRGGSSLGNIERGLTVENARPGRAEHDTLTIYPRRAAKSLFPTIGVASAQTLNVAADTDSLKSDLPVTRIEPSLAKKDVIVQVNDHVVKSQMELEAYLIQHAGESVTLTVERSSENDKSAQASPPQKITAKLDAQPRKDLGLWLQIDPIIGVQTGSPAAEAGVLVNDLLVAIDGQPLGDPMTLAERIRRRAGQSVTLTVERGKPAKSIEIKLTAREAHWQEQPTTNTGPLSIPALGIALPVINRIAAVEPGGPAEQAGVKAGEVISKVEYVGGDTVVDRYTELEHPTRFDLDGDSKRRLDWPTFDQVLQSSLNDTHVKLTLSDGREVVVAPRLSTEFFVAERGLDNVLEGVKGFGKADNFSEAVSLGLRQTKDDLMMVYRFLQKLGQGQVSGLALRGPGTMVAVAVNRAGVGFVPFLLFLAALSANLAVVNFLPIPVLDGGHMVFLLLEWIRGKPVSEQIAIKVQYAGLAFILCLMLFVISMDIGDFLEMLQRKFGWA